LCPILKTKFYETAKVSQLGDEWQSAKLNDTMSIAWTKTDSTSGPLEKTFVGIVPCSDPNSFVTGKAVNGYYRLENRQETLECEFDFPDILAQDFRYKRLERH